MRHANLIDLIQHAQNPFDLDMKHKAFKSVNAQLKILLKSIFEQLDKLQDDEQTWRKEDLVDLGVNLFFREYDKTSEQPLDLRVTESRISTLLEKAIVENQHSRARKERIEIRRSNYGGEDTLQAFWKNLEEKTREETTPSPKNTKPTKSESRNVRKTYRKNPQPIKAMRSEDIIAIAKIMEKGELIPNTAKAWESVVAAYEIDLYESPPPRSTRPKNKETKGKREQTQPSLAADDTTHSLLKRNPRTLN